MSLLLIACLISPLISQNPVERLRDVKTVYVDDMGTSDDAKVAREKLINRLAAKIGIADLREEADAILKGAFTFDSTAPIPNASLVLRLQTKDKRTLWTKEIDQQHLNGSTLRDSVINSGVKELIKAIEKDKR